MECKKYKNESMPSRTMRYHNCENNINIENIDYDSELWRLTLLYDMFRSLNKEEEEEEEEEEEKEKEEEEEEERKKWIEKIEKIENFKIDPQNTDNQLTKEEIEGFKSALNNTWCEFADKYELFNDKIMFLKLLVLARDRETIQQITRRLMADGIYIDGKDSQRVADLLQDKPVSQELLQLLSNEIIKLLYIYDNSEHPNFEQYNIDKDYIDKGWLEKEDSHVENIAEQIFENIDIKNSEKYKQLKEAVYNLYFDIISLGENCDNEYMELNKKFVEKLRDELGIELNTTIDGNRRIQALHTNESEWQIDKTEYDIDLDFVAFDILWTITKNLKGDFYEYLNELANSDILEKTFISRLHNENYLDDCLLSKVYVNTIPEEDLPKVRIYYTNEEKEDFVDEDHVMYKAEIPEFANRLASSFLQKVERYEKLNAELEKQKRGNIGLEFTISQTKKEMENLCDLLSTELPVGNGKMSGKSAIRKETVYDNVNNYSKFQFELLYEANEELRECLKSMGITGLLDPDYAGNPDYDYRDTEDDEEARLYFQNYNYNNFQY